MQVSCWGFVALAKYYLRQPEAKQYGGIVPASVNQNAVENHFSQLRGRSADKMPTAEGVANTEQLLRQRAVQRVYTVCHTGTESYEAAHTSNDTITNRQAAAEAMAAAVIPHRQKGETVGPVWKLSDVQPTIVQQPQPPPPSAPTNTVLRCCRDSAREQ